MSVNRCSFLPEKHTPVILVNGKPRYDTLDGKPLPAITLEVFSTTNPDGPGHNWVKRRFIDVARNGEIFRKTVKFFDNLAGEEIVVERTQVAIFGSFFENPYLDPIYRAGLIESCSNNPNLHAAWIEGRWDVSSGGAIDDLWNSAKHIVPRFQIPANWKIDRSFDWGSTHPFSTVWWAEANGEELTLSDGSKWCPYPGSLFAIEEDYGTEGFHTNKGLKLSAKDVALRITKKEETLKSEQWIKSKVQAGPADNQIRNVNESDVDTIESKMADLGIYWTNSDKSPGSRVIGLQLLRDRLQASVLGEGPGIYFMRNCLQCIELLPPLPRDPEKKDDVDCWVQDTLISTPKGEVPIQRIEVGDYVDTPIGPRRVTKSYISGKSQTVVIRTNNGSISEGTKDHKLFAEGYGLLPLCELKPSFLLSGKRETCQNILSTMESSTLAGTGGITTLRTAQFLVTGELACIGKFGLITTDQYLKDIISTTLTTIQTTIALKTYKWSMLRITLDTIWLNVINLVNLRSLAMFGLKTGDGKHFAKMLRRCVKTHPTVNLRALIVLAKLEQNTRLKNDAKNAQRKEMQKATSQKLALFAEKSSCTKHTQQNKSSLVVQSVDGFCENKLVYNLTVEQAGLYYANGMLSSNTEAEDHLYDAVRYRVLRGSNKWAIKIKTNWIR